MVGSAFLPAYLDHVEFWLSPSELLPFRPVSHFFAALRTILTPNQLHVIWETTGL